MTDLLLTGLATLLALLLAAAAVKLAALRRANRALEARARACGDQLTDASDRLAQSVAALEAERTYLAAAIDILPIPILMRTRGGRVHLYNRALADFYHLAGEPLDSDRVQMADPATGRVLAVEEWPGVRAWRGEVISGQELLLTAPDGDTCPVLVFAGPITRDGAVIASVVAFQDISALKAADRAKDEFLAVLSHELKTPLTCVLAWAEVAAHDASPEVLAQALAIIRENALRQRQLVNELLDLSRVVHRQLRLRPEPADLWAIACRCAAEREPACRARDLAVELAPPPAPLPVRADPARLAQAIGNLLDNAVKYTGPGGRIILAGALEDGDARLSVTDTGRGIAPDRLAELFSPFRQLERDDARGGLGLGLALVRGIVELHGGRVTAESAGEGRGSAFTLRLPRAGAPGAADPAGDDRLVLAATGDHS